MFATLSHSICQEKLKINKMNISIPHVLVLGKSAVKSMNDHNLSIFGSISMKFSL